MKRFLLFFMTLMFTQQVQASLLISPIRVLFEDRDRVQQVTLVNSSNQERTYRIEWSEQTVNEFGTYIDLAEEEASEFPRASQYLRFSPSQVTLAPGERQTVKLLARRPGNLLEGDYRSHLNFIALPPKKKNNEQSVSGIQMQINVLMSYSIPVILREGNPSFAAQVDFIDIKRSTDKLAADIIVKMSRVGSASPTGRLEAFCTPLGSDTSQQVGVLNGFNFFPDQTSITKEIIWQNFQQLSPGRLEVKYVGEKEYLDQELVVGRVTIQ